MKKYLRLAAAAVVLSMTLAGCGGDDSSSETTTGETTSQTEEYEDLTDKLNELSNEIIDLAAKAEPLHEQGKLDSDKYAAIQQLSTTLEDIGTEGNSENMLKYNELKKQVDELTYDVNAAENPQGLDEDTALTSLMECIEEAEPVLTSANEQGKLPDDRLAEFEAYKTEVQGYIDGTTERGDNLTDRLAEIRSDITTMASQAEADNELIDKLIASPVTVDDKAHLEELIDNYLMLQDEVQNKVNAGELEESKLTELMTTGVKVAELKEALQSGNITEETKESMTSVSAELKTFAEGIGSSLAESFN